MAVTPRSPVARLARTAAFWTAGALALTLAASRAEAQSRVRAAPPDSYFIVFSAFNDGDYKSALKGFRDVGRGGIASTEGRWIDSICYFTMMGECYYHMGNLGDALDNYNAALQLYLAHRDWLLRIEFPPGIDPEQNLKNTITWGNTSRKAVVGHFQDRYQSFQGRLDNDKVIQQGGVVAAPQLYSVYVIEILRCTATAIRRRGEIMGPACPHDPFTAQIVDALARRPAPPNHWSQCFVELELGLAYAAAGKGPQAVSELQKSLLAGGVYDHPLTGMALLELGKIAFLSEKYDAAATYFLEATYTASLFEQYDIMEEAFRLGHLNHMVARQPGVYPPLVAAAAWAKAKRVRQLNVSLLTCLAEGMAEAGETAGAAAMIAQAKTNQSRSEMALGVMGSRINYQAARIAMDAGNLTAGNTALNAAMTFQRAASKRLFQIALVDRMFGSNMVTERVADMLYEDVLREPTSADWIIDPMDTMAVAITPHPLPLEHWFELSLVRKEHEKAIEIADRIRRHRFFSTMVLGGRILALRWILEASPLTLSERANLQRKDILLKFPKYDEISQQATDVRRELEALPLVPTDKDQQKQQTELLERLEKLTVAQELMLQQMALRRIPSEFAFPPLKPFKEIQKEVPEGRLVLAYLQTSRNVHAFAFTKDQYAYFTLEAPAKVKAGVVDMLKKMGHVDRNQPLTTETLRDQSWKVPAAKLTKQLTNNASAEDWTKYRELIVVPDGVLWYLPFEALEVPQANGTATLTTLMSVRYAPTVSLILPDGRGRKPNARTAIVAGKLLLRDEPTVAQQAAEEIAAALPGSYTMPSTLPASSVVLSATIDRLIVLSDIDESDRGPFTWSPLQIDRGKPGSTLADWIALPWASPNQIVLPGYHTPAETALKKGGTGDEVFLSVCGLMATGSRTILMSRWRVGGQTTTNLVREFVQELPHQAADQAWRRSVQLTRNSLLDPELEGRVKASPGIDGLNAEHPFFWAGYMLVDTGSEPKQDAPQPEEPMPMPVE